MKPKIKIISLSIKDYDSIISVWERAELPFCEGWRDSKKQMKKQMNSGVVTIFGARLKKNLIGVVLASDDTRKGWINHLAVLPEFRRGGIAQALVKEAEKLFKKKKIKIVAALIEGYNKPSLKCFLKMGYWDFKGVHYMTKREHKGV